MIKKLDYDNDFCEMNMKWIDGKMCYVPIVTEHNLFIIVDKLNELIEKINEKGDI